ncbi:uncharacterized protein LOC111240715 [Vigna radiata var. radiata]|uniref:Uncharacterized protein LOC111240715 n=1 Tax=Vigna radiata var. radiata TaxID=3916 RepID=A0A3Q0ELM2_VIGRR|nr:uncharacterized protein LOC111240715 [Vigna radiata var. radiata]
MVSLTSDDKLRAVTNIEGAAYIKDTKAILVETHYKSNPKFNFHKYMICPLKDDFKQVVGISPMQGRVRVISYIFVSYVLEHPNLLGMINLGLSLILRVLQTLKI